jgi:hypothetical protein
VQEWHTPTPTVDHAERQWTVDGQLAERVFKREPCCHLLTVFTVPLMPFIRIQMKMKITISNILK